MTTEITKKFPRRPPRLDGVFPEVAPLFFVTFNTFERRPFLACNEIHEAFRAYCRHASEHGVLVGRYVIMPDHVHLFALMPRQGILLADWIRQLRTMMGKVLKKCAVAPPYWQEGFFDHLLRNSESYEEKWEYMRQNPVRAGLASNVENWPHQGEIDVIRL